MKHENSYLRKMGYRTILCAAHKQENIVGLGMEHGASLSELYDNGIEYSDNPNPSRALIKGYIDSNGIFLIEPKAKDVLYELGLLEYNPRLRCSYDFYEVAGHLYEIDYARRKIAENLAKTRQAQTEKDDTMSV